MTRKIEQTLLDALINTKDHPEFANFQTRFTQAIGAINAASGSLNPEEILKIAKAAQDLFNISPKTKINPPNSLKQNNFHPTLKQFLSDQEIIIPD